MNIKPTHMKEITKHRQRKMNKALEERDLVRLWHKQERLWMGKRACNIVALEYPVQRGWNRFFVLRQDIARSPDADMYKGVLKWVNTSVHSRRKDFMYKPWNSKVYKPMEQGISFMREKEWKEAEKKFTIKQKSLFDKRWHTIYRKDKPTNDGFWGWHLQKDWMFTFKIEPYWVTHRVVINPQLESETAEVWARIWSDGRYYKIAKKLGWRVNERDDWDNRRANMIRKAVSKLEQQDLNYEEKYGDTSSDQSSY